VADVGRAGAARLAFHLGAVIAGARARGVFGARRRRSPVDGWPSVSDPLVGQADGEQGVVFARRLGGERALPVDGLMVLLSPERLCRHVLVSGATGSGKTETLLRLAWTLAKSSDAAVFYLDGKGDRDTAARFVGLMADAGRRTRVFPYESFDGWRGSASEVQGRLMEIIDYASSGPAAWYRDIAKNVLRLVCEHPDGPPRSSHIALERMNLLELRKAHSGSDSGALRVLTGAQVSQVRLRYEAFFGQTRGALDGGWAWEDTTAAYLVLDSLALRDETKGLARFLFEDFAHYFTTRKARERFCVLIVDEFSALARGGASMAARVEQARGFNTALVLAPQVVQGLGGESEAARILGSVETIICHRVNTPEEIIDLAGTKQQIEYTARYTLDGATGEGSTRLEYHRKIDPNKVRALPAGQAYLINRGRAMRAQILQAPNLSGELPAPKRKPIPAASQERPATAVPPGGGVSEQEVKPLPF
jgi:Bacterial protein of unknown function (DUF853)